MSARITPNEISERLKLGRTVVLQMLKRGQIPAMKTPGGGKWLISRARYEQWEQSIGDAA